MHPKVKQLRQTGYALLAAVIWGTAFVAQSVGAGYVGSFTFNAARALLASIFLWIICLGQQKLSKAPHSLPIIIINKELIRGGLCCGTALTIASYLQQKAMETTASGKAGFITALYILLVPLAGMLLGRRVTKTVWMGVILGTCGLYCLCITDKFTIVRGDIYLLLCAMCFTVQIMLVDHFAARLNGIALSCAQFTVMTVLSSMGMFLTEAVSIQALTDCAIPILYMGIMSSGVGYTLQILAQKDSDPTVISLLLSLESLFATIGGAIILHDHMTFREYTGCGLMLIAVMLAQLPEKSAV